MKTFAAVVALLLAVSASAHEASHLKISTNAKSVSQHHVEERVVDHKALAKKQDMFYRMAHMKSTPWDSQPAEREAKCEDLCMLNDFWEFQQVRNCLNRPTSLCSIYKTGLASMDVVLTVAECTCGDNSTSSSTSFDDDSGSA